MSETLPANRSEYTALVKRFPAYAGLGRRMLTDARLTRGQKLTLGAGLGYLASPIDLIPGFIPVLGQLDDALVVLLCIRKVIRDYDEDAAAEMLADAGLSREQIDEDIVLVKGTMTAIAKKTASVAWSGLSRIGRAAVGKARALSGAGAEGEPNDDGGGKSD